jgi:hypothetical protein
VEREFVETRNFSKLLSRFDDCFKLLIEVQQEILRDLEKPASERDIISGTGGFNKVRVALKDKKKGKSGSLRVIYYDCTSADTVILFFIYSKTEHESISKTAKKFMRQSAREFKSWQKRKK